MNRNEGLNIHLKEAQIKKTPNLQDLTSIKWILGQKSLSTRMGTCIAVCRLQSHFINHWEY